MAKYRRKSKEIEAFQYDGDFMNSSGEYYVPGWAVEALKNGILYYDSQNENDPPSISSRWLRVGYKSWILHH